MKTRTLDQIAAAMLGSLPHGGGELVVSSGVATDTRTIAPGSLFFALVGERFDAHDYLAQAVEKGAVAVVAHDASKVPADLPVVLVDDTLASLQRLARHDLAELDVPTVLITGSNGKTSTKDFTRAVLSEKFRVHATAGNFNNHIGLPLTILAMPEDTEIALLEIGMNHPGELAPLCEIAPPDVSVITSVGTAHIEFFPDQEGIAKEKAEVGKALTESGTLILPANCAFSDTIKAMTCAEVWNTGGTHGEVSAEKLTRTAAGSSFDLVGVAAQPVRIDLPVPGDHMVSNALLAAAVGKKFGLTGVEIAQGLANLALTTGRMRQFQANGVTVLDDSYNANPDSMAAGLQTLAGLECDGKKGACLGAMGELGQHAAAGYQRVGALAAELELDFLVSVGPDARAFTDAAASIETCHFDEKTDAASHLLNFLSPGDLILFKGSRTAAMEDVMNLVFPNDSGS